MSSKMHDRQVGNMSCLSAKPSLHLHKITVANLFAASQSAGQPVSRQVGNPQCKAKSTSDSCTITFFATRRIAKMLQCVYVRGLQIKLFCLTLQVLDAMIPLTFALLLPLPKALCSRPSDVVCNSVLQTGELRACQTLTANNGPSNHMQAIETLPHCLVTTPCKQANGNIHTS